MNIPTFRMHQVYKYTNIHPFECITLRSTVLAYLRVFNYNLCIFILHHVKLIFGILPCRTLKVLERSSRPAWPLVVPGSIKGLSVCMRAFIAHPFRVTWITLFLATRFGFPYFYPKCCQIFCKTPGLRKYCLENRLWPVLLFSSLTRKKNTVLKPVFTCLLF